MQWCLVLWLLLSALVSGLVWPLSVYDGIFLGFWRDWRLKKKKSWGLGTSRQTRDAVPIRKPSWKSVIATNEQVRFSYWGQQRAFGFGCLALLMGGKLLLLFQLKGIEESFWPFRNTWKMMCNSSHMMSGYLRILLINCSLPLAEELVERL